VYAGVAIVQANLAFIGDDRVMNSIDAIATTDHKPQRLRRSIPARSGVASVAGPGVVALQATF
jgi:hypothetical protein